MRTAARSLSSLTGADVSTAPSPLLGGFRGYLLRLCAMGTVVVSKLLFTVTFPRHTHPRHVPLRKLQSLARKQLSDGDVIETIDHLFKCYRCLENYRRVRDGYLNRIA